MATLSETVRKRQRSSADGGASIERSTKRQQTLTQMPFFPPSVPFDIEDEESLESIQDIPPSMDKKQVVLEKKIKQNPPAAQKNTLTQMGHFTRFPLDSNSELDDMHLGPVYEQEDAKTPGSRAKGIAIGRSTPRMKALNSTALGKLNAVPKFATNAKKRKAKIKLDPWELSSSQPEVDLGSTLAKGSKQATSSPNIPRSAKAAAAEKIKSLSKDVLTTISLQRSQELHNNFKDTLVERWPKTPQKVPKRRNRSPNQVIPSSTSPESLPPSAHSNSRASGRKSPSNAERSPLEERSINVLPVVLSRKENFTKLLRKIDRERSENLGDAPSESKTPAKDCDKSSPKTLIVKLPVRWPPVSESKSKVTKYSEKISRRNQGSTSEANDLLQANSSPPILEREASKLLVDGWPELEHLLGRPKARVENLRQSTITMDAKHAKSFDGVNEVEADYSVGLETQLAFERLGASSDSKAASATTAGEDHEGSKIPSMADSDAGDDKFSLGSPIYEISPKRISRFDNPQQAYQTQQSMPQYAAPLLTANTPTQSRVRTIPTSSTTQSPCQSTHRSSSSRYFQSTQLPSLNHQSQISTQEYTQQPPPSTFAASSHRRNSPTRPVVTIKDSDPSLPLYEIPPHYLYESEEDELFNGDLDPTPRRPGQTQSTTEADHTNIELEFSPPSSPSPTLLAQVAPTTLKHQKSDEDEHKSEDLRKGTLSSSSPILKNGVRHLRESLLESLPGPPLLGNWDVMEEEDGLEEIA